MNKELELKQRLNTIDFLKKASSNEWMIENYLKNMVSFMSTESYNEFISWLNDNEL